MANSARTNIKINPEKVPLETDQGILESEENKWGLPLKDVYKHGLSFYKDKDGKAMQLSYEDKLKLVAYTQQTMHGPLDINSAPPVGVLDMIGKDRRAAWQALGQMSQIQAMAGFIHTLDRLCPLFKPYLEAIHKDLENKKQQRLKKQEEERAYIELENRVMLEKQQQDSNKLTEEQQVQRIKDALNAQSYGQFLQYAQQNYPGNFDQQAILIRQLQDQHYQQYIQQVAADNRLKATVLQKEASAIAESAKEQHDDFDCDPSLDSSKDSGIIKSMQSSEIPELTEYTPEESREEESDGDTFPPIEEARMWTNPAIQQFKQSARSSGGTLTAAHGETVTVRVPTYNRARSLCWEFATDNYDIGFGLYFEWSKSSTSEVTIHVSESDDEDGDDGSDDYYGIDEFAASSDPEVGSHERDQMANTHKAPVSIVIPIYRRDSHIEAYAGSHTYPGEGVYLLKFDNSYSLWRAKTIYYKVYYTH